MKEHYVIRKWATAEGLPQNSVNAVLQSKDGYIWLGTQEGLVRFDGVSFRVYDKNNTKGLQSNHILCLFEDKEGTLWIGTYGGGLHSFKQGFVKSYLQGNELPADIIMSVTQDNRGILWIGTGERGLWTYDKGFFKICVLPSCINNVTVRKIYVSSNGSIWVGTEGAGLFKISNGIIESISIKNVLSDKNIYAILEDNKGLLWLGTGKGLIRYRNAIFENISKNEGPYEDLIRTICQDSEGALWVGTRRKGLYRLYNDQFCSWELNDNEFSISIVMKDKEDNMWIGTNGGGLFQLRKAKVSVYLKKHGISNDVVWTTACDSFGRIWLGTSSGISCFSNGKFQAFDNLTKSMILALFPSIKSGLWIGTRGDGLMRIINGKAIKYGGILSAKNVWAIQEDINECVWIGSDVGLFALHNNKVVNYTIDNGLPSNMVYSLLADGSTLWLGTKEGLCRMAYSQFRVLSKRDGLSSNVVVSLYQDKEEVLWIGTYGGGLNRLKDGKFTAFTKKEGLFDNVVFQIVEDKIGDLWMSSNNGIFSVSKKELNDFAESRVDSFSCKSLGTADGLVSVECNGGTQPAGCLGFDGKIWFPTIKGIAIIDPYKITLNKVIPPVTIEETLINGNLVKQDSLSEFGPGRGDLEIHYTALSFVAPEKVFFKYRLEGFDSDWVEAGTRRTAYYTNIPPGKYSFRVIACNNDGVWNNKGAVFDFGLKPHWYQTYFFYLFCVLTLFLILFALYRVRIKVIEAQSVVLEERNRLAREIHDGLAQELTAVRLQLQAANLRLQESPQKAKEHIEKALELTIHGLEETSRSIWALQQKPLGGEGFVITLQQMVHPLFNEPSIKFEFHLEGQPVALKPEEELNMLKIAQEATLNAIKYAQADLIELFLHYEKKYVRMTIKDNGKGMIHSSREIGQYGGFGLTSIAQRVKNLGGTLRVSSQHGCGTEIEAIMPLRINTSSWRREKRKKS